MRIYSKVVMTWDTEFGRYITDLSRSEWREYSGPVELCCGASSQQKEISTEQSAFYKQMTQQAGQIFGMSSDIFKELQSTFQPIVDKGVNQEGFSAAEKQNLENEVTNDVGSAYKKAADATNAQLASEGGGDVAVVSSNQNQVRKDLAQGAASQEGAEREKITSDDYAQGRQNYFAAASALSRAPDVFGASTNMANAATGAGNAASSTANEIAQQDNSWVNATIGALGTVAGATATGGMANLGKTGNFWGA